VFTGSFVIEVSLGGYSVNSVWVWINLIAIRISIAFYRDKSWHTPNKFLVAFLLFIIIYNIVLEVELEALDSINTSKLKNITGLLTL